MKKPTFACIDCDFVGLTKQALGGHRKIHKQAPVKAAKEMPKKKAANPDKKKAAKIQRREMRQEKYQHIPRPENFDISGCGVRLFFDHLTFIPDFDDPKMTVAYLDKEKVCLKCRKRYKIDEAISKRRRK